MAAALICAATDALTVGKVLTFLKGGPKSPPGTTTGATTGGTTTGGVTGGTTTGATTTGTTTPGGTMPVSPARPKTTNLGVTSRFDPSPAPFIVKPLAANRFWFGK